ncbi:MAG: tetratricopeptide repeat protein [Planctomycetota bacterium]
MRRLISILACVFVVLLPELAAAEEPGPSMLRAWEAWEAGRLDEAVQFSTAGVQETPDASSAWVLHGYLLSSTGRKYDAANAYAKAVALDSQDAVAHNNYGVVLLDIGRLDEAEREFRHAIAIDADYADPRNNLGVVLERQGRRQRAARAYRAATEVDPDHAQAHNNRGALALRMGRAEEARAALERANALAPELGAPVLNLALLAGRDVQEGEAYAALLAAADVRGAPRELRARALAARAARETLAGHFENARALYLQALALTPSDTALLNNIAVTEDQLGMDREAILHLEEALMMKPDLHVARNNVGVVLVHRGSMAQAEATFRQIIRDDPALPSTVPTTTSA